MQKAYSTYVEYALVDLSLKGDFGSCMVVVDSGKSGKVRSSRRTPPISNQNTYE